MDLIEIDLTRLIGGDTLTILYTISINRLGIKFSSLINTRVNSYTFINTKLAQFIE
jgi:hypothetical protein